MGKNFGLYWFVLLFFLIGCGRVNEVQFEDEQPAMPDRVQRHVEGTCSILFDVCDSIQVIAGDLFDTEYSNIRVLDHTCYMDATGRSDVRGFGIVWAVNTKFLEESCQLTTSWEEFRNEKLGRNDGLGTVALPGETPTENQVAAVPIDGITNYFYKHELGFVRLYFQNPIDEGIYLVDVDGRPITTDNPKSDLKKRVEHTAKLTSSVIELINDPNTERTDPEST